MNERTKGILLMALASIGFGVVPILVKFTTFKFSAIISTFLTYLLSMILILPLFFYKKKANEFLEAKPKAKLLAFSLGFFAVIVAWLAFVKAVELIGATVSLTIIQMQPIFVLFLGLIFLKEKVNLSEIFAVILVLVAIPMIGIGKLSFEVTVRGVFLSLVACFSFAICTVIGRYLAKIISPLTILTLRVTSGVILLIPLLFFANLNELLTINLMDFGILLGIVLTGSLVPYLLYYESLKRIKAITGSVIETSAPIVTAAASYSLLHEVLTTTQYMGIAIAIIGIIIISKAREV